MWGASQSVSLLFRSARLARYRFVTFPLLISRNFHHFTSFKVSQAEDSLLLLVTCDLALFFLRIILYFSWFMRGSALESGEWLSPGLKLCGE
jgi:hypothetical protein